MHPNYDTYNWLDLYFGIKKTYDTDPVLVGAKRAIKTITTTTDDFF